MPETGIAIGDCLEIPLPSGQVAYCQCIGLNEQLGYMVRVFDKIGGDRLASATALQDAKELFPPVFVAIRPRRWRRIGRLPVVPFDFPRFRHFYGSGPGTYQNWRIWDGRERTFLGALPPELRQLEVEVVWTDIALENRIATGVSGFEHVQ
jgi:hypothetical protein